MHVARAARVHSSHGSIPVAGFAPPAGALGPSRTRSRGDDPAATLVAIFFFGIEELAVQLEEPFSILLLSRLCDGVWDSGVELFSTPRRKTRRRRRRKEASAAFEAAAESLPAGGRRR